MNTTQSANLCGIIETEVGLHYVSPSWVAKFYGVPKQKVYRAIAAKRLRAIRVRGGTIVLDSRLLPHRFPKS